VRILEQNYLPGETPTLNWVVESEVGGEQLVELTYLASGLNWSADYTVLLNANRSSVNLVGVMTLTNLSGTAFANAQVNFVGGSLNRLGSPAQAEPAPDTSAAGLGYFSAPPASTLPTYDMQPMVYEYALFTSGRALSLADGETKQLEFLRLDGLPATVAYILDASPVTESYSSPVRDVSIGTSSIEPVQSWLNFSTSLPDGIGGDLPAGQMRVFQRSADGTPVLIGESPIRPTPEGETLNLYLGDALDIVGERTQRNVTYLAGNVIEETIEIRLRNYKSQPVEVRVVERLFRWSSWVVFNVSTPFTRLNPMAIDFRASVPAGQETVVRYIVRYTWPGTACGGC
jgi:hypothetical protein